MRTLNKNKVVLWLVEPTGTYEAIDSEGFLTGEIIKQYGTPIKISINLYPSFGEIVEQIFGKDASYDMLAVSNEIILTKESLLFYNEPLTNFDKTYDFRIDDIKKSLNTMNYGLRSRT